MKYSILIDLGKEIKEGMTVHVGNKKMRSNLSNSSIMMLTPRTNARPEGPTVAMATSLPAQ